MSNHEDLTSSETEEHYSDEKMTFRKIGKFNDIYSPQKRENNFSILKYSKSFLSNQEDINALILDGPKIRTCHFLKRLNNIKNIVIVEGNEDHFNQIKTSLLEMQKFYINEKLKITVIKNDIFKYKNNEYLKKINLVYLDINTNFFSFSSAGAEVIVKRLLKRIKMQKIVFAVTFTLRNPIKDFIHSHHCSLIEIKLKEYFHKFGFKVIEKQNIGIDGIYKGNSGHGNLYFNVFCLKRIN